MKDTIAAIATAMNHAGIGIVRISGSDAFNIIDGIYESKDKKKKLSDMKSHTIHYGFIKDGEEIIDEVMVLLMRSPNSYTKEDTIEIDCHGGVFVTKKILETVIKYGARLAEPGEFTKRAFLNGRMDLSEAEAVMDVIQSESEYALKNSIRQLKGSVHNKIKEIREKIIYEIAFIESALDDPEHISIDGYGEKLEKIVDNLCDSIKKLLITFQNGRILKEGIQTVIVGKPNAGKSSLLNVLAGEERAIVTDIAGTTRDALEVSVRLSDIHLNIIDTAGIHNTEDIVEKIGVEKAKEYAKDADLLLYMADSSVPLDKSDEDIIKMLYNKNVIVLLNKTDLNQVISKEEMEEKVNAPVICISAKEETGIEELENTIKKMFFDKNLDMNHDIFITNVRHKNALEEALNSLLMVKKSIEDGMPEDFYSIDLMNSYEVLGKITGEAVEDDLVNEIFSKFCTGK